MSIYFLAIIVCISVYLATLNFIHQIGSKGGTKTKVSRVKGKVLYSRAVRDLDAGESAYIFPDGFNPENNKLDRSAHIYGHNKWSKEYLVKVEYTKDLEYIVTIGSKVVFN